MTTETFLPKDSRLVLLLSLPGLLKPIRMICRVMWVQQQRFGDHYDCGVEFIEITPEDRQEIIRYVEGTSGRLSGTPSEKPRFTV